MAARDSTYFSRLFKAVTRFYQDPNLDEIAITDNKGGAFFDRKSTVRMIRYLLPSYRVFEDDNELFKQLYLNQNQDLNLRRLLLDPNPILSDEAHQQLEEVNKKTSQQEKKAAHLEWVRKFTSEPPPRPSQTPPEPEITPIPIEVPSIAKEASSQGQRLIKRLTDRYLNANQLLGIAGALGGGAVGTTVGGPMGGLVGAGVGGTAGLALAEALKNNPEVFSKAGKGGLDITSNMLGGINNLANFVPGVGFGRYLAAIFIGLFVFPLLFMLGGGEVTQTTPTASAAPITSDISSCQFIRSDHNPKGASYKSPLLISYFQEASKLTGIPLTVFAAFARVESPGLTNFTDDQVRFYSCAKSPTGALGVMQLQPQGTLGHAAESVANGARIAGLDYNSLTESDYCDVRKSVLMGAGFILKKMSYFGYGDGTKWDPAWTNDKKAIDTLVNTYYGCLKYPSCSSGPFNYGDDVFTSIQNCKVFTATAAPPPSPDIQLLTLDILKNFGVSMDKSFSYDYLKWTWEILWQVSNTNFLSLVRGPSSNGIAIIRDDVSINHQIGCSSIGLRAISSSTRQPYPESLFKVVLIHELAHIIESCYPQNSRKNELANIISQEGYLTNYSQFGDQCVGSINLNEDYAETITYFLNRNLPEQSLGIGARCEPPSTTNPYTRNKPLHQKFAEELLTKPK